MHWNRNVRPFDGAFMRWLPKALLLGGVPSALGAQVYWNLGIKGTLVNGLVGAVCSVIVWGGYELLSPWILAHPPVLKPRQAGLLALGKWMVAYGLLIGTILLLTRRLFHIQLSVFFVVVMGLLISSLVVSVRSTSSQVEAARALEQVRAQANLMALKSQLSPHTLFNGLNAIAALIPKAPKDAERGIEHLSVLLRQIMEALDRESWTLGEEFDLVRHLLELEKLRFGSRLNVELVLPEEERPRAIPPLLLVPLVENSLKHGFRPKIGTCSLSLVVEGARIRIQDDGVGRRSEAPEGVGLRTVRHRLDAIGGYLKWPATASGCMVEVCLCR